MKELLRNPHLLLTYDAGTGVVRMARTARPYESIAEMRAAHGGIAGALDDLGREGKTLLVDTRLAPPRNDDAFEDALRPIRARITRGFARVAVLAQTVIGQLQVQRQARESEHRLAVFTAEQDAIAYLRDGVDLQRIPPRQSSRPPGRS